MKQLSKMTEMEKALEAVLLFHSSGIWDKVKRGLWYELTGSTEATTKVLCDVVRKALESADHS